MNHLRSPPQFITAFLIKIMEGENFYEKRIDKTCPRFKNFAPAGR